jgi:hypothetical protein
MPVESCRRPGVGIRDLTAPFSDVGSQQAQFRAKHARTLQLTEQKLAPV